MQKLQIFNVSTWSKSINKNIGRIYYVWRYLATYQCYRDFITIIINYILLLNTFISLIVTSVVTAILLGMPLNKIMETIEAGMGSTLGHIALIFGLGAMLGKLLADGGGARIGLPTH